MYVGGLGFWGFEARRWTYKGMNPPNHKYHPINKAPKGLKDLAIR